MIDFSSYEKELELALTAAKEAGKVMDEYQEGEIEIDDRKSGYNDIVTEADRECQKKVVETISEIFPEDGFLGEEENLSPDDGDRVWIIDPIDGTTNFQRGRDYFCCSIALRQDGEYKIGVVNSPDSGTGKLYYAVENEGVYRTESPEDWRDAERISVSDQDLQGALGMAEISSRSTERLQKGLNMTRELMKDEATVFRMPGAAALELCEIAEGGMDFRTDFIYEWDYAAGNLIVEEAGGQTDTREYDGKLRQNTASNGIFHETLMDIVRKYT